MNGHLDIQLPGQHTSFVGREAELDELARLLRSSRLVTIAGTAGLGKTRLAIEVAGRLPDGAAPAVRFVGLASLADGTLVPQEVAARLGATETVGESLLHALAAHVGARPMLLVLDNCEHVVEASAQLIEALLRDCASLRVLATSRQPLRVPGELVWRIAPLGVPDQRGGDDPRAVAASEAVRLFEARARVVLPGFSITPANAPTVAVICRCLDGIPLAIELAAARLEAMPVEEVLARLEDRFRLLASGGEAGDPRHRTLQAALDWGHQLLDDREQRLFRRTSVFSGGFDLEAAEAVCADGGIEPADVRGLVFRLAEKSLLVPETGGPGPTRYRLLETVRQYGGEHLARSGERTSLTRRHADHYLALAERAALEERGLDQPRWLQRLESDVDNLRTALAWLRSRDAEACMRLAGALSWFWVTHSNYSEGRGWLESALAAAGDDTPARADGLLGLARLCFWQGDYAAAQASCVACLDLRQRLADDTGSGWALTLLGSIHAYRGEFGESRRRFEEAIDATRDALVTMEALVGMGEMLMHAGDLAEARTRLEEVLRLARGPEAPRGRAELFLGLAVLFSGDAAGARAHLDRSIDIFHRLGNRYGAAAAFDGLAGLAVVDSDPVRALRLSGAAAALRESTRSQLAPRWREALRTIVIEPASAAVGDQAAAAAWADGERMTFEDAVRFSRERPPEAAATLPAAPARRRPAGLSPRELEVAELVARGMTNGQIAERLFIAERTVEGHVERIRGKLNVRSRSQVAAAMLREQAWPSKS